MTIWTRIRSAARGQSNDEQPRPDDARPHIRALPLGAEGEERERLKAKAREVAGSGDVEAAARLAAALHAAAPDAGFVVEIGRIAEWRNGTAAARAVYDAALRATPDDAALIGERAALAFRASDHAGLIQGAERALSLAPADARLAAELAEALFGAGRAELALQALGRAVSATGPDPDLTALVKLLIDVCGSNGPRAWPRELVASALGAAAATPEIAALLERDDGSEPKAPGLKPKLRSRLIEMGHARLGGLKPDQFDGFIAFAEQEGELRPLVDAAYARRLAALARASFDRLLAAGLAEPADVIAIAKSARRGASEDAGRGNAERLGVLDLGIEALGGSLDLLVERARCWMTLGAPQLARQDAARACAIDPASPYALGRYADALWRCERRAEARDLLARHLEREPDDLELGHKFAQFSYWDRDVAAAEAWLRKTHDAGARTEAIDFLHVSLLVWLSRYAEAEAIAADAIQAHPSPRLEIQYVSIALHIVWPTLPDYADPVRVAKLEAAFTGADLDALDGDLIWNIMTVLSVLKRRDSVHGMLDRALISTFRRPERPERFWAYVARTLAREDVEPALRENPAALARALADCGLGHIATGGAFWAPIAFRIALALNPQERAAAFNAGFAALGNGEIAPARRFFDGLDRIYHEDMERVAWPRMGQAMWPMRAFGFADAFEREKPDGADWPRISVITPSYNQGGYIEETILSVLNQEYPNLEYIVIDAVSTDETAEVLERYRGRIDQLVIEPDRGQTDAINKGIGFATGELITWINSDDILAPGALFAFALKRIETGADLIYGMCLAHRDYRFDISNLPAVRQATFDTRHMAQIFRYWLKGFFFYQPEVIFSREIFAKAGGRLDESLYYTMDYDFWLRCAKAEPVVSEVRWPIALFRHHEAQKTANMLDCVLEQAEVRDRQVTVAPDSQRAREIRARLGAALSKPRPRVALVSARLDKVFSRETPAELTAYFAARGLDVSFVGSAAGAGRGHDVLIKLVHLQYDADDVRAFREQNPDAAAIGWFWDSHHHLDENFGVVEALDLVVPGHAFAAAYLASDAAMLAPAVALPVSQWSEAEAARWADAVTAPGRSDDVYGGFVRYAFSLKRNALIEALIADGAPGVTFLEEHRLRDYFGRSPEERFRDWAGHKASLCLPLARDLSQRFFDALLTGQVPIVAPDVPDIDVVIPREMRDALPVVRLEAYTVEAVRAAHAEALHRFDEGGPEAALARHRFALKGHMLTARIEEIIAIARREAAGG